MKPHHPRANRRRRLLPPLLLVLCLGSARSAGDDSRCAQMKKTACVNAPGTQGLCCYPDSGTEAESCQHGCQWDWGGDPKCASGCHTASKHDARSVLRGVGGTPDWLLPRDDDEEVGPQICCIATPDSPSDDDSPMEHNVVVYPAAAVGVLFLLVSCYCYLRSPRRANSAMESRADTLLRTAFLKGHDKQLMSRKADRSVWERHWNTPLRGEDDEGGGARDEDYEEGLYVWRRRGHRRGSGADGRGSEHGSMDSIGSAVLEATYDGPQTPPPRRGRAQGLRKQGWVRHFIDKSTGKSGGYSPRYGNADRSKGDPAVAFSNVKLDWRPASDAAPSADPVNPAPSRKLRTDISDIEQRPFSEKVQWFYSKCREMSVPWEEGHVEIRCRRNALIEDSVAQFKRLARADWRKIFRFSFVGEPALDAGGVSREWFETVSEAMFCTEEKGLFCRSDDSGTSLTLAPPLDDPAAENDAISLLTFCGELVGKAIFDRRTINAPLILPLFKHIVAAPVTLRDLQSVDSDVYRSLLQLLAMDEESLSAMCLDFTVTRTVPVASPRPSPSAKSNPMADDQVAISGDGGSDGGGSSSPASSTFITVELTPGGSGIDVDSSNVEQYVEMRVKDRMLHSINNRLAAFLLGIYAVVPQHLLSIFDYMELELVLGGMPAISLEDWKLHTVYAGDYTATHEVVQWFWKTVKGFEPHEQAKLLQFVTGSSRMPTHGFEALQGSDGRISKFCLVSIPLSVSVLPKSSTCFNRLYLPMYEGIEQLEHFLRITTALDVTGFGME